MLSDLRYLARSIIFSGGDQNFLGAAWVPAVVNFTPKPLRKAVALRILGMSPHYLSIHSRKEAARVKRTREQIASEVLVPHLRRDSVVLDYGCGPGYLAKAVASRVKSVDAVDISAGALACAGAINAAPNLRYLSVDDLQTIARYDVAYSFAVIQHVTDDAFDDILHLVHRTLKPRGKLLFHVALEPSWRSEDEWRDDSSLRGRVKMRYGLHCFRRDAAQVLERLQRAGFAGCSIRPMAELTSVNDDIARQHMAFAVRP